MFPQNSICLGRANDFTAADKPAIAKDFKKSSLGYYSCETQFKGRAGCNKMCANMKDCNMFATSANGTCCYVFKAKTLDECKRDADNSKMRYIEYKVWPVEGRTWKPRKACCTAKLAPYFPKSGLCNGRRADWTAADKPSMVSDWRYSSTYGWRSCQGSKMTADMCRKMCESMYDCGSYSWNAHGCCFPFKATTAAQCKQSTKPRYPDYTTFYLERGQPSPMYPVNGLCQRPKDFTVNDKPKLAKTW
jgi:hypothetical protein